jgi:hypothetical protein
MNTHYWVTAEITRHWRAELIAAAGAHRGRRRHRGLERPANISRWWHNEKAATAPVPLVVGDNRG